MVCRAVNGVFNNKWVKSSFLCTSWKNFGHFGWSAIVCVEFSTLNYIILIWYWYLKFSFNLRLEEYWRLYWTQHVREGLGQLVLNSRYKSPLRPRIYQSTVGPWTRMNNHPVSLEMIFGQDVDSLADRPYISSFIKNTAFRNRK